jgi:starch synthase
MKILFVASEVAPFAKTGGLADVTGSLPKELKRLGHDVRIILPLYKTIRDGGTVITGEFGTLSVPIGASTEQGTIRQTHLGDILVYLLEHDKFFGREYLYGTPSGDYHDNPLRFAFFCRGVLEFLRNSDFQPDILHCHDWQTALIPIILRHEPDLAAMFSASAVIFTIHNLAYQGLFPQTALDVMGLDQSYFTIDRLEYYGRINLMKGAILSADLINTVSETYCREIQTPEYGCGLDGVLRVRRNDLSGIVNGLDYSEWDPATDRDLFSRFSVETLEEKKTNKLGLQGLLGLEQSLKTPLFGIVSRLSAQKGFDLVARLLPRFVAGGLQLVILGSGEEKYIRLLQNNAGSREHTVSFNFEFDSSLAHKIYAGADIFLMPSSYEPCGLGQLIALRYGTIPVVRKTGGLADTVFDPAQSSEPTGFSFSTYSASALWLAVTRALETWRDPMQWDSIVRRAMGLDFSWHSSAVHYEELYRLGMSKMRDVTHD